MPTVKEFLARFKQIYQNPDEHIAVAIWCVEDVKARAKERGKKISDKQAEEIVDDLEHNHDASIGISWDTIDCLLDFAGVENGED